MGGHRQKRNFKEFTEPTKVSLFVALPLMLVSYGEATGTSPDLRRFVAAHIRNDNALRKLIIRHVSRSHRVHFHTLCEWFFLRSSMSHQSNIQAKRAYNSIASFSKVVMAAASDAAASLELTSDTESSIRSSSSSSSSSAGSISASPGFRTSPAESNEDQGLASRLESYGPVPVERLERRNSPGTSASTSAATSISTPASTPLSEASSSTNTSHTSHQREGITDEKGNYAEFSKEAVHILCERVDVFGKTRPMEAAEEIPALQINTREVGLIKEAPARRWQAGQEDFDHKYRRLAKRVVKTRAKITAKSERLLTHAREEGLVMHADNAGNPGEAPRDTAGVIQDERRWGPLDLDGENPPPSAIAGRRDTVCFLLLFLLSVI